MSKFQSENYGPLVAALDQGTSSTRFLIFSSKTAEVLTSHQIETTQIYPQEGWVEQNPEVILSSAYHCIDSVVQKLKNLGIDPSAIKTIGITNQRETTIVWDKISGKPLHNAIIWLDTRTIETVANLVFKKQSKHVREKCGLPLSTYFSAVKLLWLKENVPEVKKAIEEERCLFGTVDSWLIWNLTGGITSGIHMTDVTNASRTMLMNIRTLQWDPWLCNFFSLHMSMLPTIRSCSEIYGYVSSGSLKGVPISGCVGDQSGAMIGQMCFKKGQAKNTYGTGCFLLYNTGKTPVMSDHGLLTTIAYKLGPKAPVYYALEGSVAIAGAAVRWLRDNLNILSESAEVEDLAKLDSGTHGVYFVPAFSGLYAPYWDSEARGIICGLTQYTTKAHIARSTLEAVCFQTREILDAMNTDCKVPLQSLQVDGGMTCNDLLMQLQADILGIPVVRPSMLETTALGAAMAAGAAEGIHAWSLNPSDLSVIRKDYFNPNICEGERQQRYSMWKKAVQRSLGWLNPTSEYLEMNSKLLSIPGGLFLCSSFAMLILAHVLME